MVIIDVLVPKFGELHTKLITFIHSFVIMINVENICIRVFMKISVPEHVFSNFWMFVQMFQTYCKPHILQLKQYIMPVSQQNFRLEAIHLLHWIKPQVLQVFPHVAVVIIRLMSLLLNILENRHLVLSFFTRPAMHYVMHPLFVVIPVGD